MFLAVFNIVGRYLGYPVPGYIDYMEQARPGNCHFGHCLLPKRGRTHPHGYCCWGSLKGRALWVAEFIGILGMLLITAY